MTTEIQYTQNGSNYTFTLVKTGGPADAQIANVDWTFGDGTTGNGNPITKTILGTVPIKVFANFTDSRGCTKKTNLILPSCGCSGNPTIVSNTQTWNTPITSAGNIVMMPGARLTVQANLKMGPDCKIFVLNGARLNVNNATIDVDDSSCNGVRWGGIEVLGAGNTVGHPALSTITANNAYPAFAEHGVAYLNHATINRAQTAIQTEQKGIFLGGIVVADVTNFNDNIIGADIGPFSQDNVSQFIECQFIGVPLLSTPGILTNHFAVRLTQNKGVQIRGGVHTGGIIRNYQYGIWAANFSYYLNSQVINTAYGGAVNINTGVNPTQVKIGIGKPGYIDGKNNFESGDYGVYSDGPMNCDINQNTFETKYGTVNYGVNDSRITNNFFLNNSAGIYLNNTTNPSSMGSVKLDCNTFSNLTHGILAYQSNKTSTFESNFFENIQASDVEVYGTSGVQGTMQKIMGSLQKGITNIFSSPIEDFKVSSNTIHHTYIAQNLLNNTYGNAWIPRCPDNPSPLYDFDCNYTSNFNRFRLDNQLFANCLTNKTIPPIIDESDCRSFGCLINYINSLNNVIDTVVDYSSTENYWNLLKIKESSYNSLFAKYLEDNNTDSLTILLSLENTETNKDRRIQYLVYTHNYSTAKSLIQSLPSQTRDEIDRIVLWYINIDRVEKDSNFFLQPNDRLFLNDVINNQRLYAPRAMAILSITDGVLFDPILPTDTLEQRSNVAQNVKGLNIYPNPASNEISIEIPDFDNGVENTYTIYSLDGVQRLNGKINSQKQQVDLSQLCNGFYIVKLTIAGKMTSKKLIISTH